MALDLIYGLRPLLLTAPDLVALVGSRMMPVLLEQGTDLPALTYSQVGGSAQPTFETSGMITSRVEFCCWGRKYSDADGVRKALVAFLNGWTGVLSDGTRMADAEWLSQEDDVSPDSMYYRCVTEFYLHHT